jgi:hypothetical protein
MAQESPKWQYMLYTLDGTKEQQVLVDFNGFGSEGWELVAFLPWVGYPDGRAVFKCSTSR